MAANYQGPKLSVVPLNFFEMWTSKVRFNHTLTSPHLMMAIVIIQPIVIYSMFYSIPYDT